MFARYLADADVLVLLAESAAGEPVGMMTGHVQRRPDLVPGLFGQIGIAFVREEWRGRGIASALVRRVLAFFAEYGVEQVTLHYVVDNAEAERFWGHLGFEPRIVTAGTTRQALEEQLKKG